MSYSEVLNDVGASYDANTVKFKTNGGETAKAPINFGEVFKEKYSESMGDLAGDIASDNMKDTAFSTSAATEFFRAVPNITAHAFPEELGSSDTEELDSAISFDEIEELDDITAADEAAMEEVVGISSLGISFDDLDFSLFEEIEDIV